MAPITAVVVLVHRIRTCVVVANTAQVAAMQNPDNTLSHMAFKSIAIHGHRLTHHGGAETRTNANQKHGQIFFHEQIPLILHKPSIRFAQLKLPHGRSQIRLSNKFGRRLPLLVALGAGQELLYISASRCHLISNSNNGKEVI